jgi:hypothetical protein
MRRELKEKKEDKIDLKKAWGLLGHGVQRLFEDVPETQRHIIFFEDLIENPASSYRGVLDFLELPYDGRPDFPAYNQYQECRNPKLDEYRVRINRLRMKNPILRKLYRSITAMLPTQGLGIQKLLLSINYKKGKRKELDEDLRKQLVSEFYDDICLLEQLTGRDLGNWKR